MRRRPSLLSPGPRAPSRPCNNPLRNTPQEALPEKLCKAAELLILTDMNQFADCEVTRTPQGCADKDAIVQGQAGSFRRKQSHGLTNNMQPRMFGQGDLLHLQEADSLRRSDTNASGIGYPGLGQCDALFEIRLSCSSAHAQARGGNVSNSSGEMVSMDLSYGSSFSILILLPPLPIPLGRGQG